MTLRSSDLQSDSDLDSIHNSCDVQSTNHNARTDRPQLLQLPPITKAFPCNLKYCQYSHHDIPSPKSFPVIINSRSIFRESCQKVNLNPLRLSTQTSWISVMKKKKRLLSLPASHGRITFLLMMVVAKQIIFATSQKNSLLQLFQGKGEQFNFNMIFESL